MIQKITPYIYIAIFYCFSFSGFAQKKDSINIKLISVKKEQQQILDSIKFSKTISIKGDGVSELNNVLFTLSKNGYFISQIDSIKRNDHQLLTYIDLGPKTTSIKIPLTGEQKNIIKYLNGSISKNTLHLKSHQLQHFMTQLTNHLNQNGSTFSKAQIINPQITNDTLIAELHITKSNQRKIDKIITKGYDKFPKSFLNNHFEIIHKPFSKNILKSASSEIQQLNFVSEIKKPEVLFSKDSTILFLYLKKKESNTAEGLINFNTENKKLKFKGYLDLKLNNIFDKGEEIHISWNSLGNQKQNFNSSIFIPYIYNSKFSVDIAFDLYKHDSTFTNSNFQLTTLYSFNSRNQLKFSYQSKNSSTQSQSNNLMSFQKRLFGLGYSFTSKSSKPIQLETSLYYGNRVISSLTSTQTQFDIAFSKEFRLTKSLDLFLKNTSSKLISNNIGQNELFRVGGPNSIRGFNYQSIFTDAYSLINNELRFLLSNNSKIYSIHDLGIFSINQTNSLLYSIGLGYQIPSKNNLVNISFSKGYSNASFVKNSQVFSVNLLSFF